MKHLYQTLDTPLVTVWLYYPAFNLLVDSVNEGEDERVEVSYPDNVVVYVDSGILKVSLTEMFKSTNASTQFVSSAGISIVNSLVSGSGYVPLTINVTANSVNPVTICLYLRANSSVSLVGSNSNWQVHAPEAPNQRSQLIREVIIPEKRQRYQKKIEIKQANAADKKDYYLGKAKRYERQAIEKRDEKLAKAKAKRARGKMFDAGVAEDQAREAYSEKMAQARDATRRATAEHDRYLEEARDLKAEMLLEIQRLEDLARKYETS